MSIADLMAGAVRDADGKRYYDHGLIEPSTMQRPTDPLQRSDEDSSEGLDSTIANDQDNDKPLFSRGSFFDRVAELRENSKLGTYIADTLANERQPPVALDAAQRRKVPPQDRPSSQPVA